MPPADVGSPWLRETVPGNVLQDAGIKIDSVASGIATKSGRAMIEALIDGSSPPAIAV